MLIQSNYALLLIVAFLITIFMIFIIGYNTYHDKQKLN